MIHKRNSTVSWCCMAWQVGLIVGLLVGTVAVGTFVGLQIAQEGKTAVLAVSEALPTWSLKPSNETTALATQAPAPFPFEHAIYEAMCLRSPEGGHRCTWQASMDQQY